MSRSFDASPDMNIVAVGESLNNLAEVTQAAWIKPIDCGDTLEAGYRALVVKNPSQEYNGMWLNNGLELGFPPVFNGIQAEVSTYVSGSSGPQQVAYSSSDDDAITLDVWQHVAFTYSFSGDRKVRIYINGVEVSYAFQQTGGAGEYPDDSSEGFYIGGDTLNQGGSAGFNGLIAEVAIWNVALSAEQIAQVAASVSGASVVLPGNLAGYWHLCGLQSPEPDSSGNSNFGILSENAPTQSENSPGFSSCSSVGPATVDAVFPGPYRGNTLAESFKNSSQQDIIQVVNQGGNVIWSLDASGVATDNPSTPTSDAVLAKLYADSFSEAFRNPYQLNILQVINQGGNVIFYVDYQGNAVVV